MIQISFYQTDNIPLEKTVTQLVEKCYTNGLRCTILTSNSEFQEHLNKHLWTYSQKQFIPHGSKLDPLPEAQPIYITDALENINNSTVAIIVDSDIGTLRNIFSDLQKVSDLKFTRLILIANFNDKLFETEIKIITQDLINSQINFDYYKQSAAGWVKK